MENFFSPKRLGVSLLTFVATGFLVFSVARATIEVPHGPGALAAGTFIFLIMLVAFAIVFPVIRFLVAKPLSGKPTGRAIGFALADLVLFSLISVASVYGFFYAEGTWQGQFSERAAEEIVYEATIMQDKAHCEEIPSTQQSYKDACRAIFENDQSTCQKALSDAECRQNMILANAVTPECESEADDGCGYAADKAIWARAIRDSDSSMCRQITSDDLQGRCQKTLENTQKLYSGTIQECMQAAQAIDTESGGYYECIVGTAMYQNDPDQCSKATKENIYPRLSEDLKQFDYHQEDRLYKRLRQTCRQQLTKDIDIEYGKGHTASSKARDFYSIPERVDSLFSSVVFGG